MANDRTIRLTPSAGDTALGFDFPVAATDELAVTRMRAGVTATLVLDSDYSVTGLNAENGGTVMLTAAAQAGDIYLIDGTTRFARGSNFDPALTPAGDMVDAEFDRQLRIAEELARDIATARVTRLGADADAAVAAMDGDIIVLTGTLTANRTLTLDATPRRRRRYVRTGGGAFTVSIGGLKTLAQNTWCDTVHDGETNILIGYGAL